MKKTIKKRTAIGTFKPREVLVVLLSQENRMLKRLENHLGLTPVEVLKDALVEKYAWHFNE
jgi:hypothetical protein